MRTPCSYIPILSGCDYVHGCRSLVRMCGLLQAFHGAAAVVGGYVAGMTRRMMGGTRWLRTFLLTATLFFLPMLAVLGALYATAAVYHSTTALPLQDAAAKLGPWLALAPFLAFLGSLLSTAKEVRG